MDLDYYKSLVIRTPFESSFVQVKRTMQWINSRISPENRELLLESGRVDQAIRRLVNKTSNCIDVGSHLGSLLSLLVRLSPQGRHIAIEPIPRKAEWLRRKFPEVEVKQVALSDRRGEAVFYECVRRTGFSGFRQTGDPQDEYKEFTVHCERLDDYLDYGRPFSFIKIDAEGAEFVVLRGAMKLIRRDRPSVLFESVPGAVERFGQGRREFFEFLTEELGYAIFLVDDFLARRERLDWDRFDRAHTYPFKAMNYLAIFP